MDLNDPATRSAVSQVVLLLGVGGLLTAVGLILVNGPKRLVAGYSTLFAGLGCLGLGLLLAAVIAFTIAVGEPV